MVLSQPDIRRKVDCGEIVFAPELEERQWGEASVDLRLGFEFTKLRPETNLTVSVADGLQALASSGLWREKKLAGADVFGKPESFILEPNEFVLALTYERVTLPPDLIGLVEGRSTYARVGLAMHQTAPWIQPGWSGRITLEIRNSGPIRVELTPLRDMPCQLTFLTLSSPLPEELSYGGRVGKGYQDQVSVLPRRPSKQ